MEGWIKLYRNIENNWLWEDKPFSRGQAFISLLLMANHKDNKFLLNGELIEVKRGSKITSIRKLSEYWGWSSTKVKKFLEQLKSDEMITYKSDTKKTLVSIVNYSIYQDSENEKNNTKVTQKSHRNNTEVTSKNHQSNTEITQKNTNNNDNNDNNENNEKNEKNEEEGKEKPPTISPISFPTPYHKKIFENVSEVTYRTWFNQTQIKEQGDVIEIITKGDFFRQIIRDKYSDKLQVILGKKILVKEG